MRYLFFTFFIGLMFSLFSQEKSPRMIKKESGFTPNPNFYFKEWMYNTPGYELKKFTNHHYLGIGAITSGSAISYLGIYLYSNSTNTQQNISYDPNTGLWDVYNVTKVNKTKQISGGIITVIGGLISLTGTYFILEAPTHIKRAGLIMNQNGVGIKIKLNTNTENQDD